MVGKQAGWTHPPKPQACPCTGRAQDEGTAVATVPPSPARAPVAWDTTTGGAGGLPGKPDGLGAVKEPGAGQAARGATRGPAAGRPPGPVTWRWLLLQLLLLPSPMLGAWRQRRLPEHPEAKSRAGPLSASLRAASALLPQSGHGLRGPHTAPDCRRPGQRGLEQAQRRGGAEGEGRERKGAASGTAGS